jgi:hypothetical protein
MRVRTVWLGLMAALCGGVGSVATAADAASQEPLVIQEQGSFSVGGIVLTSVGTYEPNNPTAAGQTYHGDHAYAFSQVPAHARKFPLVFWHGAGQFTKTWETTPDGREGFQNIFLRRGYSVYLIDQPRRGNAGRSTVETTITPTPDEQVWFDTFRIGIWPNYFPDVQFSRDFEALNQFFRSMTPNTGPFDTEVITSAVSALFDKTGPAILVTHSQSGGPGWITAMKNPNVRAVVAYEPGSGFIFPEGEVAAPMPSAAGPLEGVGVPLSDFLKLTKFPSLSTTATTPPSSRRPTGARITGGSGLRWLGCSGRPSTAAHVNVCFTAWPITAQWVARVCAGGAPD